MIRWLYTLIARLMSVTDQNNDVMRSLAALNRHHTRDMRDRTKERRGDGV